VKDRVVAIHMIYTSCKTSCPLTMANLVRVHKLLAQRVGRDIFMYSITLDPKVDSVEVLRDYAKGFEVAPAGNYSLESPATSRTCAPARLPRGRPRDRPGQGFPYRDGALRQRAARVLGMGAGVAEPESIAECLLFAQASKPGEVRVAPNFTRSPSRPAHR
jgi:hypothetical protein